MKVLNVQIPRLVKTLAVTAPLLLATPLMKAQQFETTQDVFVKTSDIKDSEIADSLFLSPEVIVAGEPVYPAVVVDLSENRLYHYDYDGCLKDVHSIASGKRSTPTKPGLRVITNIEEYPYKSAGKATKRRKNPNDYGPFVICLANVDMKTGKIIGSDGQFLHGTNNPSSIGKNVSKGCVRVNNEVIEELAKYLDINQYVLIKE